ncbi:DUF6578 domain-containing protein [Streptomyces europaeiscabiei]|uniref:DUF6578 domain-containing protein n=1 Tax=Streptomyces europaeiscabiei TaxID=146819 RepID=UPI002B26B66A|nr:DUF6578 domain-containing protein [Streptomyces europaeiscabiei]
MTGRCSAADGQSFAPGEVVSWTLLEVDPEDYADVVGSERADEIDFREEHHGHREGTHPPRWRRTGAVWSFVTGRLAIGSDRRAPMRKTSARPAHGVGRSRRCFMYTRGWGV